MTTSANSPGTNQRELENLRVDSSELVGHDIIIISDQYSGQPLKGKIMAANQDSITVGRAGSGAYCGYLESEQQLYVQFTYRGQRVSVRGKVIRCTGGHSTIALDEKVVPLSRRRFFRMATHEASVRMAVLPLSTFNRAKIGKLRWVATDLENISGGGAQIRYSSQLTKNVTLFINVAVENLDFPALLLAQVRHCNLADGGGFMVGLEFIVSEQKEKFLSAVELERVPAAALVFSEKHRESQNNAIIKMIQQNKG